MGDKDKTKEELIRELAELRRQIADLQGGEHKRTETTELLRKDRDVFFSILAKIPYGVMFLDKEEKILFTNPEFTHITGYTSKDVPTITEWLRLAYPDDKHEDMAAAAWQRDHLQRETNGLFRTMVNRLFFRTFNVACRDGTAKAIEFRPTVLDDGSTIVMLSDVTDRQGLEKAFQESEQKYRSVIERAHEGISIIQDEMIKYANPRLAEIWGGATPEIIGTRFTDYIDPSEIPALVDRYNRRMKGEHVSPTYETVLRRKDNSRVDAELSAGTITYEGRLADLVFVRDITERRRAEEELRRHRENLEDLVKERTEKLSATNERLQREITKRKEIEEAHDTLKQQIEFILGATKTGLDIIDSHFNIVYIDSEWAKVYGDPKGRKCYEYFMDRTEVCPGCGIEKALEQKKLIVTEEVLVKENNRPIQVTTIPFQNEKGEWLVAEVNVDITERKRTEDALKESEGRFRILADKASFGISIMEPQGCFEYFNARFTEIFGYTQKDIPDKKTWFAKAYPDEEYRKKVSSIWHDDRQTKEDIVEANQRVFTVRCKDGVDKIIEFRGINLANGKHYTFYDDITPRKKIEELLQQEKETFFSILQNALYGAILIDEDGNYLYVNPEFTEIMGYTLEDIPTGRKFLGKAYPDKKYRQKVIEAWKADILVGGRNKIFTAIAKDGERKEIEYKTNLLEDGRAIVMLADITERRRAEEELRRHRENLEDLVKERTEELGATNERLQREIAERQQSEEELRNSEKKYRELYQSLRDGIASVNMRGQIVDFNSVFQRMLGYSAEEIHTLTYEDITPPKWHAIENRILQEQVMTRGYSDLYEKEYCKRDGTIFPVELRTYIVQDEQGKPAGMWAIVRDITDRKRAEEALQESEGRLAQIIQENSVPTFVIDHRHFVTHWNKACENLTAIPASEIIGTQKQWKAFYPKKRPVMADLIVEESPEAVIATYYKGSYRKSALIEGAYEMEVFFPHLGEDGKWLFATAAPLTDARGNIVGAIETLQDVTDRKRMERELRDSEEKYRSLVQYTEDSVYLINRQKQYLFMNEKCLARIGLPQEHIVGREYGEFHSPEENKAFSRHIEQVFKTGRFVQMEHRSRRDGRYFLRTLSPVKRSNGSIDQVTVIAKDITERKKVEEELTYVATHDSLTGLPNRMLFHDRLALALVQAHRHKNKLAVMLLDLDFFKHVNDSLGHNVGDQLLRAVGNRLTGILRKGDTVARIGGDEFIILLSQIARTRDATAIADKIMEAFRKSFVLGSHELLTTASMGIAIYPSDGDDADVLMKHADIAMYRAKDKGRDNYQR